MLSWLIKQNAITVTDTTECYHHNWHNRLLSVYHHDWHNRMISPWLIEHCHHHWHNRTLSAERCAVNLSSSGCRSVGLLSTNGEPIRLPCHIMIDWQSCWHCSSHHRHTLTQHGSAYGHGIITFKLRSKIITKSETLNRTEKGQLLDPKSDWKRAVVRS